MKKGFSILILLLSVIALIGVGGGAYYLGTKNTLPEIQISFPKKNAPVIPTSSAQKASKPAEALFSGTVKKINKDLGLFKITDVDKENGVPDSIAYYEAGTYLRGEYKDYTRILAIRPAEGPGPSLQFILATKDYSSYLLDDPNDKTGNYPSDDWDNPYMFIDKSKIANTVTLDTEHTKTIAVEKPFTLIRQDSVLLEYKKTGQKNKSGYDIYIDAPMTEFDKSSLLASSKTQLSLYAGGTDWGKGEGLNAKEKAALTTRNLYLSKTTLVHGVDSTGLTYSYVLSTEKEVGAFVQNAPSVEQENIAYKKQAALFNEKKLKEYPEYPKTAPFPGLRFIKSDVGLATDYYNTYDAAFPGACGGAQSTFVVDTIKDVDLEPVTSNSDYPLFTLKDTKNPLYELAYQTKTEQGEESFKPINDNKSMPSLNEYISKNPLLFFKDAWGRWVVVGEYDLKLMGGCGKPVVYLYPEKQTTVHLSFSSPVALNTNIPTYRNGWLVSASPDGVLTDLQPQYTDCSKIDGLHAAGSEYAPKACKSNSYPYIYWSGKSVENFYPPVTGGWVVERKNLLTFMREKLNEMGLNNTESGDMISYWVPKMSEKNAPYYQIGFLQTKEMNDFIPMQVDPRPDSVLRIFLDWKALSSKPTVVPVPQRLEKVSRNGFTLVEWGGLLE